MKTLKFTIIILAFVLGAFASIGILQPTVEYGVSVNTSRNHMTTWKVMAADDLMSEWIEGFKSVKLIEGELNTLGSKYEVVIVDHGEDSRKRAVPSRRPPAPLPDGIDTRLRV